MSIAAAKLITALKVWRYIKPFIHTEEKPMEGFKTWTQSRGAIANAIGTVISMLAVFGVGVDGDIVEQLPELTTSLVLFVTNVVGFYGRIKATDRIIWKT